MSLNWDILNLLVSYPMSHEHSLWIIFYQKKVIYIYDKDHHFSFLMHVVQIVLTDVINRSVLLEMSISSYHACGACFNPNNAFNNLHIFSSCPSTSKPLGWNMYTSSFNLPFRSIVFISRCENFHLYWTRSDPSSLKVPCFITRANMYFHNQNPPSLKAPCHKFNFVFDMLSINSWF